MKTKLFTFLIFTLQVCGIDAQRFEEGGLTYDVTSMEKSEVTLIDCQTNLSNVNIPDTIVYSNIKYVVSGISSEAFALCHSLDSLTIPVSVTEIGKNAFYDCASLVDINVAANNSKYFSLDGVLFDKDGDKVRLLTYPQGNFSTTYVIPDDVVAIEDGAFRGCQNLSSITIPQNVVTMGNGVFWGCSSLATIEVSSENANFCSKDGVLYSKDQTLIMKYPAAKSDVSYAISDGVSEIGDEAFAENTNLTDVTIPSSVKSIGDYAFSWCSSLNNLSIPDGVSSIGDNAFYQCSSLLSVTLPEKMNHIGEGAFRSCSSLTSIVLPEGIQKISADMFSWCTLLSSVTIPVTVTSIENYAFFSCSSLSSVIIPENVSTIGNYAFSWCTSLRELNLPSSVLTVGTYGFSNCTSLASLVLSENMTNINDYTFDGCTSLRSITFPEGLLNIGTHAFSRCSSLTSVTFPNSISSITGDYAFSSCTSLSSVSFPESMSSVGDYTFSGCTSLSSVNFTEGLDSVGNYTFNDCTSLYSVSIPKSMSNIGTYTFNGCTSLTKIFSYASVPPILIAQTFNGLDPKKIFVYVPEELIETYKMAMYWSDFNIEDVSTTSVQNPEVLTEIYVEGNALRNSANQLIEVYDLNGRKVYRGSETTVILSKGMYLVRSGKYTLKIVI